MFREYYFEFRGFKFVSSVDVESPFYQRLKLMPESLFIQMNLDTLSQLLREEMTYTKIGRAHV